MYEPDDKLWQVWSHRDAPCPQLSSAVPSALPALSEARATTISLAGQTLTWSQADSACDGLAEFPQCFWKLSPAPLSAPDCSSLQRELAPASHMPTLSLRCRRSLECTSTEWVDGVSGSLVQGTLWRKLQGLLDSCRPSRLSGQTLGTATCVPPYSEAQC